MNNDRFYLQCPYDEKDECKALGGRWDNEANGMCQMMRIRICSKTGGLKATSSRHSQ